MAKFISFPCLDKRWYIGLIVITNANIFIYLYKNGENEFINDMHDSINENMARENYHGRKIKKKNDVIDEFVNVDMHDLIHVKWVTIYAYYISI